MSDRLELSRSRTNQRRVTKYRELMMRMTRYYPNNPSVCNCEDSIKPYETLLLLELSRLDLLDLVVVLLDEGNRSLEAGVVTLVASVVEAHADSVDGDSAESDEGDDAAKGEPRSASAPRVTKRRSVSSLGKVGSLGISNNTLETVEVGRDGLATVVGAEEISATKLTEGTQLLLRLP